MKIIPLCLSILITVAAQAIETQKIYLSGTGADDAVVWDFKLEKGRGSGEWTTIKVPSCWELQGFGEYQFRKDKQQNTGFYKTTFSLPENSEGKRILIFFEGVLTQADVKINGQSAGPAHQGGFYRFSYDITEWVKPLGNVLEVTVKKKCENEEMDKPTVGDYWNFAGIFRPVYLKVVPQEYIDWFAIDGDMDGSLSLDVYPLHIKQADRVRATVKDLQGKVVGSPMEMQLNAGQQKVSLNGIVKDINLWSDEFPNLYRMEVELHAGEKTIHKTSDRFGFRRFENRPGEGFFLNGKRVVLKGAARHCFWPDTGRTMSAAMDRKDVELMKNVLNMNFVRCVHYPPDQRFLDLCDEIGLLASSELTGWFNKVPTGPGRALVKQMVAKDVNHPSVIQWHNGNHWGFNGELVPEYHKWDPQDRMVIQNEGQKYKKVPGADRLGDQAIDSRYYPDYAAIVERLAPGKKNTVQPNEALHALYDGGGGAALHRYYRDFRASGTGGGIVIWALVDEAVLRTDQNGILDSAGNLGPDGVVGPYREMEGTAFACREIFSPIQFEEKDVSGGFNGNIGVTNEYVSTPLNQISFEWELLTYPKPLDETQETILAKGSVRGPGIPAGASGVLKLALPAEKAQAHALRVRAVNQNGVEVIAKTWMLKTRREMLSHAFTNSESSGSTAFDFDPKNGMLKSVTLDGKTLAFKNGPQLVWSVATGAQLENNDLGIDAPARKKAAKVDEDTVEPPWMDQVLDMSTWTAKASKKNGLSVLESNDPSGKGFFRWTLLSGSLLKLDYSYELPKGLYGYAGIGFDLPDNAVQSKRWLGAGPCRVWKNRLHGPNVGLWENNYNNGIPGEIWNLPSFKGNFKEVCWATFKMNDGNFVVGLEDPDAYLGVLRPQNGKDPRRALWSYPEQGGLFVFNAISPVGAKWRDSREAGPSSASNKIVNPISGTVLFQFKK